eukprot:179777-Chlamydomonas_euryale.AAC.1
MAFAGVPSPLSAPSPASACRFRPVPACTTWYNVVQRTMHASPLLLASRLRCPTHVDSAALHTCLDVAFGAPASIFPNTTWRAGNGLLPRARSAWHPATCALRLASCHARGPPGILPRARSARHPAARVLRLAPCHARAPNLCCPRPRVTHVAHDGLGPQLGSERQPSWKPPSDILSIRQSKAALPAAFIRRTFNLAVQGSLPGSLHPMHLRSGSPK